MARKKPSKALVYFAAEARKQHLTYGQLQRMETIELIRSGKINEKGGDSNGSKKVSSAGQ